MTKTKAGVYLDYFDMLAVGIQMYEQAGNSPSAAYCRQRLEAIPDMMRKALEDTSSLAWKSMISLT